MDFHEIDMNYEQYGLFSGLLAYWYPLHWFFHVRLSLSIQLRNLMPPQSWLHNSHAFSMFHGEAEKALEVKQPRIAEPGYIYITVPQQSLDVEMKSWALDLTYQPANSSYLLNWWHQDRNAVRSN